MKQITIYTDGACSGNPGPGGWGALLIYECDVKEAEKEICGGEAATTNNRMELLAAIEALNALHTACQVTLYTDSNYVRQGIEEWIHGWKRNGWKNSQKKPVKNADLWQALESAAARHQVLWKWVKGHAGIPGNERADALARQGLERYGR